MTTNFVQKSVIALLDFEGKIKFMIQNKICRSINGLLLLVIVVAGYLFISDEPINNPPQNHQTIEVTLDEKIILVQNMNTIFLHLQEVLEALSYNNTWVAKQKIDEIDSVSIRALPADLQQKLPEKFVKIAKKTKLTLREISKNVVKIENKNKVTASIAKVLGQCQECHKAYRLVVIGDK